MPLFISPKSSNKMASHFVPKIILVLAASLIYETSKNCSKFVIDPNELNIPNDFYHIKKNAIKGMKEITKLI